ncbi:MAG: glycerol-3-phosphate dehydrogenase [Arenicella sp.]
MDPGKESRDHAIWHEKGLVTVTGGKLSTFRPIALEVMQKVSNLLGVTSSADDTQNMFSQGSFQSGDEISPELAKRLLGRYGDLASDVIKGSDAAALAIIPRTRIALAELRWSAAHEQVEHLDDLLLRRTRFGLLLERGGEDLLPLIKTVYQPELGWGDRCWTQEVERYTAI